MKKLFLCVILAVASCFLFSSCEKEGVPTSNLVGIWWADRTASTSVKGEVHTIYQSSTLTLNRDKTGSYTFESSTGTYRNGIINSWKVSNGKVVCEGFYYGSDVDMDWRPEFEIKGNTLVRGAFVYTK